MCTKITVSSVFNSSPENIWRLLGEIGTLRHISKPFAYFIPHDDMTVWRQGENYCLSLRIFGFISFGTHEIHVSKMDKNEWVIETNEHNKVIKIWNHSINLEPLPDGSTGYTDTIVIDGGGLTFVVKLWSKMFYKHRQRKWKKLLEKNPV